MKNVKKNWESNDDCVDDNKDANGINEDEIESVNLERTNKRKGEGGKRKRKRQDRWWW